MTTIAEIQERHDEDIQKGWSEHIGGRQGQNHNDRGFLLAKLEAIEADNKISECESEWCGKSEVLGEIQKCHRCNVKAIMEDK